MNPLRLTIEWKWATEYIRLTQDMLTGKVPTLRTEEDWSDGSKLKVYYPRVASCTSEADGAVQLELDYLEKDHPEYTGIGVMWGRSTITLAADRKSAEVCWSSDPEGGEEKPGFKCRVEEERAGEEGTREAISRVKRDQRSFKDELLLRESQCAVSGEEFAPVLEAAHIQDVQHLGPSIPENGILLRSDLHKLFDDGYFSIAEDGRWLFHHLLPLSYREQFRSDRLAPGTYERVKEFIRKRTPRGPDK